MQALLIYKKDRNKFSVEKLKEELNNIRGVSNINGKEFSDSPLALDFKYHDFPVIVRLSDDLETITIDSLSDASFVFALELQRIESEPLRVFDDGYDFHFSLKEVKSLKDLKEKVEENYFDEEALAMEAKA